MPTWAKCLSAFIPPHYYIDAMRSIYLKGSSLVKLKEDFCMLFLFTIIINTWAVKSYNKIS